MANAKEKIKKERTYTGNTEWDAVLKQCDLMVGDDVDQIDCYKDLSIALEKLTRRDAARLEKLKQEHKSLNKRMKSEMIDYGVKRPPRNDEFRPEKIPQYIFLIACMLGMVYIMFLLELIEP